LAATRDAVTDVVAGVGDAMTDVAAGIGHVTDGLVGGVDDTLGRLFGGLGPATHDDRAGPITGQRPARFDRPADGRAVLLAAMGGFADEGRIGRDEIEIRALDNGRYIVVLPGVTDLSQGFDRFAEQVREDGLFGVPEGSREAYDTWADNDEPTVRKMRYAYEAALRDDTTVNEYSTVVIDAMQAVGVPAGSEVMIVGHSFGAYTAIDLAVEPTFNGGAVDGYHVDVTHVVAAGAETDWRFDELPATTNALVLNNRWDAVYQAENLLHANASPTRPGHLEVEFWGDRVGYGHDEQNYIEWVAESDHRRVARWLDGVGTLYSASGTRVSVRVPDPNLD
jgi:dienelactone hydrolase